MGKRKRILVAPLDWGLGHASRCIPIIQRELDKGNEVVIASNGRSALLLQDHFPELLVRTDIPDYSIRYSAFIPFMLKISFQLPTILNTIRREHQWLKVINKNDCFDMIISDNRYGLYLPNVHSVIVTHQTAPIVPTIFRKIIHNRIKQWLERFNETWIPDFEEENRSLAGLLSHSNLPNNARYIGPLSRFTKPSFSSQQYKKIAIISGPEPLRSLFERQIIAEFGKHNYPTLVLSGRIENGTNDINNNIVITSQMENEDLAAHLIGAEEVVCRSGYSSVMDFHVLGLKNVRFIPTPGQTEQEYLSKRVSEFL